MNKGVFHNLSYGVYIVSTLDKANNRMTGCVANSIMQVTSDPATVAVSINHDNYTNSCIKDHKTFNISILHEKTSPVVIGTFGYASGRDTEKFADTAFELQGNLPVIQNACGYLCCEVIDQMEAPTHTVFLAKVTDGNFLEEAPPMTYAYYHKVLKLKSPKNAPTYLAD